VNTPADGARHDLVSAVRGSYTRVALHAGDITLVASLVQKVVYRQPLLLTAASRDGDLPPQPPSAHHPGSPIHALLLRAAEQEIRDRPRNSPGPSAIYARVYKAPRNSGEHPADACTTEE